MCAKESSTWEETEVPGENSRVRVNDHNTLSHATTADPEDGTRITGGEKCLC